MDKERLKAEFLRMCGIALLFFVAFYFGSFAPKSSVEANTKEIITNKNGISSNSKKIETLKTEVNKVDGKIDRVLIALCIINDRTCSLKNKPD